MSDRDNFLPLKDFQELLTFSENIVQNLLAHKSSVTLTYLSVWRGSRV